MIGKEYSAYVACARPTGTKQMTLFVERLIGAPVDRLSVGIRQGISGGETAEIRCDVTGGEEATFLQWLEAVARAHRRKTRYLTHASQPELLRSSVTATSKNRLLGLRFEGADRAELTGWVDGETFESFVQAFKRVAWLDGYWPGRRITTKAQWTKSGTKQDQQ